MTFFCYGVLRVWLASARVVPLVDDYAEIAQGFDDAFHVAADGGAGAYGDFVGLFYGYDSAIGPGAFGDGVEGAGELVDADVEVLAACAEGAQDAALA